MWIPSHIGIPGNEKADREAKEALNTNISIHKILYEESKVIIKNAINLQLQHEWHTIRNNKLREVKNTTKPFKNISNVSRKEEVLLTRLRIGHTKLTHQHILEKKEAPKCEKCNEPLSVKHIIADCIGYELERKKYDIAPNVREALADDAGAAKKKC